MPNESTPAPDDHQAEPLNTTQPMVSHLVELRDRLLRTLVIVLLLFVGMFPFANEIYGFVSEPLRAYLPENSTMIATQVASPFLTPFKLTMVLSVFAAMPFILYQTWAFIAPGLYKKERFIVLPLFASSVMLFYAGMAFAYFVVFPLIFGFFTSVGPENVTVMTDISSYLDFVLKLFFAFGIAFEIPIATFILIWTGMVTPSALAGKRPYVLVCCFVLGMLLTPPDVISQSLLAIPMWLLFEIGILFGRLIHKQPKETATDDAEEGSSES
ncbi:twin arginine-targeting protein translocase TatC [Gammaproteobacteria bacterium 53_120_T64]|nr:twin arginine-targeting protein translocase TatC [Gammaproteobacteria bacterium 53_120_T64]